MSKIGIGIGVRIDDIKKVKEDLTKQIGNIKGVKLNVSSIDMDIEKLKSQLESKIKSLTKNLSIQIKKVEIDGNTTQKLQGQIQKALNSITKDVTLNIKDIELSDSIKNKMQSKLNASLKGLTVKIQNVDFNITKVDSFVKKTKEAQKSINDLGNLNLNDTTGAFDTLRTRAEQVKKTVGDLAKIKFTQDGNGNLDKAMITYTNSLQKVVTETMGWKNVTDESGKAIGKVFTNLKTDISDNQDALKKLEQTFNSTKDKLQGQLNVAKSLGVDESVINSLQTQLNGLNANNFNQQINLIKKNFQDLGVSSGNINKLQNTINNIKNQLGSMSKSKLEFIKDTDISKLNEAKNQLRNLESLMNQMKSGKFIDGQVIASEINIAKNSMQELNSVIRQASDTGGQFKTIMSNLSSYAIGGSALYFGLNELRNGLASIKDVDTAMRDLKRVADDVSETTLDNFIGKANAMAKALGSTTEEAIDATTVWKQMGYSFEDASQFLAKQSMILGNVGDMSSSDSTNALVSTLKAFKLEAKDTESIVDSLNEAGNKFAITTGDLAEGLRVGASSLALANNDLYQSEALIVAGTEVLRDANTVANGLKTISMRLNQVKTAGGETFYKLKSDLAKVGVALTDSNDNLRSTYDVILDLSEAWSSGKLTDMTKSKLLDDVAGKQQAKVLSALIQNAEQLPVIYESMKNSMGSAIQEQESYMDSIEGKMNTLQETIKSLWLNLKASSSIKNVLDGVTSVIGVFDGLMKKVGVFPTILATVIGSLTLFNSKFRESQTMFTNMVPGVNTLNVKLNDYNEKLKTTITNIKADIEAKKKEIEVGNSLGVNTAKLGIQLTALSGKLMLTTAKQVACTIATVALQTAMSMGLSLAITGAISLLGSFATSLFSVSGSMKDCTEQAKALSDELDIKTDASNLMKQYDNINQKLKQGNLEEEERKKLNQQLQQTKNEIIGLDDDYKWIINDQNKTYEEQLTLLKAINEEKLKDRAKELDKSMSSQGSIEKLINGGAFDTGLNKDIELYKKIQEALSNNNGSGKVSYDGFTVSTKEATSTLEKLESQIKSAYTEIEKYNHNVGTLQEANYNTSRSMIDLDGNVQSFVKNLLGINEESDGTSVKLKTISSAMNELETRGVLTANSVATLAKIFPDVGINAITASSYVKKFKDGMEDTSSSLGVAMQELNKTGSISQDTINRLANNFPELGVNAKNAESILAGLSATFDELTDDTDDTVNSVNNAKKAYNDASSEIAKAKKYIEQIAKAEAVTPALATSLTKQYGDMGTAVNNASESIDFLNEKIREQQAIQQEVFETMIGDDTEYYNQKMKNNDEFRQSYNDFLNSFITEGEEAYNIDVSNYDSYNQLKNSVQDKLGISIENWLKQFVGSSATGYADDFQNFKSYAQAKAQILKKLQDQITKFENALADNVNTIANAKSDFASAEAEKLYSMNVKKFTDQIDRLKSAKAEIETTFDEFQGSNKSYSGGSIGSTPSKSSGGSGSKGSGSTKKSEAQKATEEAEKYAKKIKELNSSLDLDRYYDVNNALTILGNKLSDVKISQEYLTGEDLVKAKQKETQTIIEQMNAYGDLIGVMKQEQSELKASLANYGLMTDASGQLIDSQNKLAQMQDELNAKTYASSEAGYEAKQKDIDALKNLQDQVKRYTEVTLNEIPKATQTWNQLSSSMRSTAITNLNNLREKLVEALKSSYEDSRDKKLASIDKWYKSRKEELEEDYQSDVDSITRQKEKSIKFYQNQIDELKAQLDSLNDDTEDKQKKLAGLKTSLSQWQKDDSVFAKKKIEELNEQIAKLEKDLLKDSIQSQIDAIKDKKDEESDYYDDKLDSLRDSNKKEKDELDKDYDKKKKKAEKYWNNMLSEQKLYEEANRLIVSNSLEEIQTILSDSSENFKQIGSLLGENFADALKAEVKQALDDFKNLTGKNISDLDYDSSDKHKGSQTSNNSSSSGSSSNKWIADKGDSVWIADASSTQVYYEPGGESRGTAWQIGVASADQLKAIDYNDGYLKLQKKGETIGWVDRYLLNKWNDISSYATGGRTPSDIGDEGALSILHRNEKILNADETVMLDRIYGYVGDASRKLSDMDNAISSFKSINDYILGNSGVRNTNINKSTSNNDQSKQIKIENNYEINNYTKGDSTFSKRELEKMAIKQAKSFK